MKMMRRTFKTLRGPALSAALAMFGRESRAGTVLTTEGAMFEGELRIDHGIVVRGAPGGAKTPFSAVLRARFATADASLQPGLVLVNGGRIAGAFSPMNAATVKVEAKRISVPAKEVAWAIYQPLTQALALEVPRGKTGALLPGGDFFEGTIRSVDAASAKVLNPIFGPRTFDSRRLLAAVLRETQPRPAAFDVVTRDGSIYPALDVSANDGAGITLRHPLYDGLRVPLADVVEIRAGASRMVPLDDMKPTRVDPAPGRDAARCFAADRALDGGALKLGSRTAPAGFECATGATVWWKPPPCAGTFFALVAASPETPAGQKLTFTVFADGKLAGRSAPLAAGDPAAVLRCVVPGTESLALRIDGAGGSGVWAEPMLLRR